MFIGIYHRSNLITYIGIAAAVLGIGYASLGHPQNAVLCLIVAGIADLFDGVFARRFSRTKEQQEFGVQLDSLADVLSFIALPMALLWSIGLQQWYGFVILFLYAFAAVQRLAFYNMSVGGTDTSVPVSHYRGLPVTYAALVFSLTWLLVYVVPHVWFVGLVTSVTLILSFLFVLDIKIPKPRGAAYGFFALLSVATFILICVLG